MTDCSFYWTANGINHACSFDDHEVMSDDSVAVRIHGCGCGARWTEILDIGQVVIQQGRWHAEHDD